MNRHPILWASPSPLWSRFMTQGMALDGTPSPLSQDQSRPAILRFSSDDFMEQMLATLANDPQRLSEFLARPETWRTPMAAGPDLIDRVPLPRAAKTLKRLQAAKLPKSAVAAVAAQTQIEEQAQTRKLALKLYQPAHQRYYLVATGLVCGIAGFPDRKLAGGGREQIGFVIRRLLPLPNAADTPGECAFVKNASAAHWQHLDSRSDGAALHPGEELLPLFPMNFRDDLGHPRRMLAGMIPVGRREEYMGTALAAPSSAADPAATLTKVSARKEQFKMEVTEPWKNLIRSAFAAGKSIKDETAPPPTLAAGESLPYLNRKRAFALNLQLQMQSWLILLDFAAYLKVHLGTVWQAIEQADASALQGKPLALYNWLEKAAVASDLQSALQPPSKNGQPVQPQLKSAAPSLRDALRRIDAQAVRDRLEQAEIIYAQENAALEIWPDFHFPLAGITASFEVGGPYAAL